MLRQQKYSKGFILIFTLWVLGFLTVLAVGLASGIRQKIVLIKKIEQRQKVNHLLNASIKSALINIIDQFGKTSGNYTASLKAFLHHNSKISLYESSSDSVVRFYGNYQEDFLGVMDEERKLNINIASLDMLTRLIEKVFDYKIEEARNLANNILDWRLYGEGQLQGFFSDNYYRNLEFTYNKKDAPYENFNELLLVKGINKEIYDILINYVTIYGEGRVNINTASEEVLFALGLKESTIEKVLLVRRGKDKIDSTDDDYVFQRVYDVAVEVNALVKLLPEEIRDIDSANQKNLFSTNSNYFSTFIKGEIDEGAYSKQIFTVFSSRDGKIMEWQER